jgi:hypothetical protein
MSKGIAYQSHVIIIGEDADDVDEEEFQVWVEEMQDDVDSDSDDGDTDLTEPVDDESREKLNDNVILFEERTDLRRHLLDSSHGLHATGIDEITKSTQETQLKHSNAQSNDQRSSVVLPNTRITPIKLVQRPPSSIELSSHSSILHPGEKKNGLKRFFSLGKKTKTELPLRRSAAISIRDEDLETNWSTSASSSIDESQQDDLSPSSSKPNSVISENNNTQVTVLRIFAGNVNLGTNYKTVVVDSDTSAEDLIKRAVSRFHIVQIEGNTVESPNSRVEYYLSVKTLDGGKKDRVTVARNSYEYMILISCMWL